MPIYDEVQKLHLLQEFTFSLGLLGPLGRIFKKVANWLDQSWHRSFKSCFKLELYKNKDRVQFTLAKFV